MSDKQPTDAEENGDFVEKWEKILQGIENMYANCDSSYRIAGNKL